MKRTLAVLCMTAVAAAGELPAPVRIEAAGKPIDTEVGHAAPFVGDFDGDGVSDLLVGDYATQKPDLPEPTPEEQAEHDRLREELEQTYRRDSELIEKLHGQTRLRDDAARKQAEEEFEALQKRLQELHEKIPAEYESHGWVWLFLRKPAEG